MNQGEGLVPREPCGALLFEGVANEGTMSDPAADDHPYWKRHWVREASWSAKELVKLCCGWDPDTGWDPDCGWEPRVSGVALFDEDDVVRWTYEAAIGEDPPGRAGG